MPPDVVAALKDTEFEEFLPRLEAELKSTSPEPCLAVYVTRRLNACSFVYRD